MLSGTPVLDHEEGYLQMLELLDPDVYGEIQLEEFKLQVQNRQRISEILSNLHPEEIDIIEENLIEILKICTDDNILKSKSDVLINQINNNFDENDPIFLDLLKDIRDYISSVYKIDNRILRTRRNNLQNIVRKKNWSKSYKV